MTKQPSDADIGPGIKPPSRHGNIRLPEYNHPVESLGIANLADRLEANIELKWQSRPTSKEFEKTMRVKDKEAHIEFPPEPWNMDTFRFKRLQKVIQHSNIRRNIENPISHLKNRSAVRMYNLEKEMLSQQRFYLQKRLKCIAISDANRYAVMGDELLLRQELILGHPVDKRDSFNGRAVIHEAASSGHSHLIHTICHTFKAKVNLPTMLGATTALHLAVSGSYRQLASLLLSYGADVNARDRYGNTPLHCCSKMNLVKLLLKIDTIDPSIRNNEQLLASEYYVKNTQIDEQDPALELLLAKAENAQLIENQRMKDEMDNARKNEGIMKLNKVISLDSTLLTTRSDKEKKASAALDRGPSITRRRFDDEYYGEEEVDNRHSKRERRKKDLEAREIRKKEKEAEKEGTSGGKKKNLYAKWNKPQKYNLAAK